MNRIWFYDDRAGWLRIMQHCIALNGSFFNTRSGPLLTRCSSLSRDVGTWAAVSATS